jgi:hypothetical protein
VKIASATPDDGYPFLTYEVRLEALISLNQFDAAQSLAADILMHAQRLFRPQHEAEVLISTARIARAAEITVAHGR